MKIVVNTNSLLTPLTGIGQYTYQICKALRELNPEDRYTYYYGFFSPELFRSDGAQSDASPEQKKINFYKQMKQWVKKIPVVGKFGRDLRTSVNFGKQWLTGERHDLYFEPNFIPLREIFARRTVTMVFDLSVPLHPEWHPEERVKIFKRQFFKGLKKTDRVLTATQFIKGQIQEHLNVPENRISVTPISCNKEIFRPRAAEETREAALRLKLPKNYIAFVGSVEPRKNILGLLKAYAALKPALRNEVGIVFCGPEGWKNEAVFNFIRDKGLMDRITRLHYISDEDLSVVYQNAMALVYPSFYEGFGLPPLEALSSGCPVIVSDIPPHREVCGDAALYADPNDPEAIADAIRRVAEDSALRTRLKDSGLLQARKFSWESAARQTMDAFKDLS